MARYGQRPENALKRAHEFIDVGKPVRALETLSEVFRNKKWAYTWSESILEPIMFKYLDLCVELKKSHVAKEGLFQYRNMFQSVNVNSLENVIRFYLKNAEDRTEAARTQSQQAVSDRVVTEIEIDDLDNLATPESILLSAVSGDDAQDRSDRTILTPWVKFLWESYCQCLELLRTNVHVENLYHDIARMAFQFCLKYNRKTEFRKLCDKLRKHLEDISKLTPLVANVSLSKPETQQLNLETRLYQLDSAIQMELWQEAYKAIEDIHGLMNMSKKSPVPKTMANYYQKLALVFWKAGNYLFHAAALLKLFQLSREMKKNMSPEELHKMASRVLIASLSIPLPSAHPEFDRFIETDKSPLEKAQRLATLLGLTQPPTRQSLLKDMVRYNVVALSSKQLQELYAWLEVEFNPLQLCGRVQGVVESIQSDQYLTQYIPALQDLTLVRLVQQIAQVYQTISISRLIELSTFADSFRLQRVLVDCVRHNDMQIRVDHGARCINFGMELAEAQREDRQEGPSLQPMPSEQVRNQLVSMITVLHQAAHIINPNKKKLEREKLRNKMVQQYHETKHLEHQRVLQRHKIIEDRKEYIERKNNLREEEEARRQEQIARQMAMAEAKRLEAEREERERRRQENEIQQIKDRHLKEKMQQISLTAHGQKLLNKMNEEELKKLDAEQIAAKEAEELQKERRELQQKLKTQEKRVDYLERAKRLEELPLLEAAAKLKEEEERKFWEQHESEKIAALVEERTLAVQTAERLKHMKEDKDAFLEKLKSERKNIYLEKLRDFEKMLEEERKRRLAERREKRKEERRRAYLRQKEEEAEQKRLEEERKLQEELRKQREEEARLEKERKAKEEEQRRKENEARDKQAKIQREREEAALKKQELEERKAADAWRSERERDKPRERDNADGWRRGGGGGAAPRDKSPAPAAKEPWRPSALRSKDEEGGGSSWRSAARDEGGDRDRDRDRGFGGDRDRDRDRGFGGDRDRDRGFGGDRDRDRGFGGDRDRDRGFGGDRDRDRDRGFGGDRDRDRGFGGDRDRRGPPPRDVPASSWRTPAERRDDDRGRDDDRYRRRDDDRDAPRRRDDDRDAPRRRDDDRDGPRRRDDDRDAPRRRDDDRDAPRRRDDDRDGPRRRDDDRRPGSGRDERGSDWRTAPASAPAPRKDPPKPAANSGDDDDEWTTVSGRR